MDDDTKESRGDGEAAGESVAKVEYWVDKYNEDSLCGPSLSITRVDLPVDWEWANEHYQRFKTQAEAEQCLRRERLRFESQIDSYDFTVPPDKEHDA